MKKNVFLAVIFGFALLVSSSSFAQSSDDYVRNTKVVPDFAGSGWVHDPAKDDVMGEFVNESHMNPSLGVLVLLEVRNHNGSREELVMKFGSKNIARAAIKVGGKWYVGKGPFYDYSVDRPENDFKTEEIKDSNGNVTGVKVSLDTLDGLKYIVLTK